MINVAFRIEEINYFINKWFKSIIGTTELNASKCYSEFFLTN